MPRSPPSRREKYILAKLKQKTQPITRKEDVLTKREKHILENLKRLTEGSRRRRRR